MHYLTFLNRLNCSATHGLILLISLLLPVHLSASENPALVEALQAGQVAFNAGDFKSAFNLWQTEASKGNADAQVFVGLAYANGWGVAKSMELASIWYLKAARNNHPAGQLLLGLHYIQKTGADRAAGLQWLERAADAGDPTARDFLHKGRTSGWFKDIQADKDQARNSKLAPLALADQTL